MFVVFQTPRFEPVLILPYANKKSHSKKNDFCLSGWQDCSLLAHLFVVFQTPRFEPVLILPYANKKSHSKKNDFCLSGWQDSNLRPPAPKAGAMTGLRYTPFVWCIKLYTKKGRQRYINFSFEPNY